MEQLLSMPEVADAIGISTATLRSWRTQGRGPVGFKVGHRRVMYRHEAVEAWLAEQEAATASNSSRPQPAP